MEQGRMSQNNLPVRKNDTVEIDITGINHEGSGVGRVNGYTLFVPGVLPGERARVKVVKVKKQYGYAILLELLNPGPNRVEPSCPVYRRCGGCQLQHASYESQLRIKRQRVEDSLRRIGKLENVPVLPVLGMEDPWRYRNKAQVPVGIGQAASGGNASQQPLVAGFYARGSHRIVDTDSCRIQFASNDRVLAAVKAIAREMGIAPYDEETHRGLLRHVVARTATKTGEVMVVLVTNGEELPHRQEWIRRIRERLPETASICQNVNTRRTNVIFGDQTKVLWGKPYLIDEIGDIHFAISPRSFFQVNPVQTEVLYNKALEYAELSGKETVIDAYCGIGTISLFLARHAARVYGVEIVPEAVV